MYNPKYNLIATKIFSKDYPNTILLGEWCKPSETKIDNNRDSKIVILITDKFQLGSIDFVNV